MLEDTMEGLEDSEELEEAAQEEVDKVFYFLIELLECCLK